MTATVILFICWFFFKKPLFRKQHQIKVTALKGWCSQQGYKTLWTAKIKDKFSIARTG